MKTRSAPELFEFDYNPYVDQVLAVVESEILQIQQHMRDNFWPERWTACASYSGCPYQDICHHPEQAEQIKETLPPSTPHQLQKRMPKF